MLWVCTKKENGEQGVERSVVSPIVRQPSPSLQTLPLESSSIGLTTDLSTPCYAFRQCLCFRQADQLLPDPSFGDAVTAPVCGCCFLQCMPNPGCAQKAPAGNFTVGTPKVAAAGAPPVGAEMAR